VTLAAITLDPCETVQHDRYEGETLTPDALLLSDVQASDYDLLVVPRRHLQCGSHSCQ
jgi:protease I